MMPHAIALAITCFIGFAFKNLTETFIRFVLEEFAPVGSPTEQVMVDQLAPRAGLVDLRRPRKVE